LGVKKLAPVTVYRAMDFLIEEGFVHKLESRNAFIACPFQHSRGDLVVFMICEQCKGVDEVISEPLTRTLSAIAEDHHFTPRARVIELQGLCAHCRIGGSLSA
jgi:Fur family zinc uptake transcriptional regulator